MISLINEIIYWGLPSLSLAFSGVLFIILSLSKKDDQIKAFMFMIMSMGVWAIASLLMKMQIAPSVLFWNRVMIAAMIMIPFAAYIFFTIYIDLKRRISLVFWTIAIAIIQILNAFGMTTKSAEMVKTAYADGRIHYELSYTVGIASYFCYAAIFALLFVCLLYAKREFKSGKPQTGGLSLVVMSLFILFFGFAANVLPAIGKYPIDFFTGILASIFIMVAIYKTRVLELKFVITRALIFTSLLTAICLGSVYIVNSLLNVLRKWNTGIDQNLFILACTFLSFILFQPLFKIIYNLVNNYFYKDENRRTQVIKNFTVSIANNLDLEIICQDLLQVIGEISGNDRNYIFLKNNDDESFDFYASSKKLDRLNISFGTSHPLVRWFSQTDELVYHKQMDTHPFFKTMWDADRQILNNLLFETVVPLKYNGKLIGIVVMCSRDMRSLKDVDNIEQVSMTCVTASIAISNARLYESAKKEALMDSITSVYNHRYFMDNLISSLAEKKKSTTAIALVGVDMFNIYNDIYGHYAGDIVLVKVAAILKQMCGSYGVVCRYAGDIFAIVLPYLDTRQVYELMEKIRVKVESSSMTSNDEQARFVTCSIGICVYPTQASDDKELVKKASAALIEAKKTGRNKTVIYSQDIEETVTNNQVAAESQMATIYALTAAIDAKDHFTFGHSQRVAKYATAIAEAAHASSEEIEIIRQASLLHDIGKIGIPEHILTKFTRLSTEEYETMKKHVDMSIMIIKYLPALNMMIPSVIGHHERWDGKGYPRKIKGENIAFGARCIALADAFDAITSDRHYKSYMSVEYALEEIASNAGTQFDPVLAEIFVKIVQEGKLIIEPTRNNFYTKTGPIEQVIS